MYYQARVRRNKSIEYIILANALVFFLTLIAPTLVGVFMALQPATVFWRPWTLFTTMFVHADFDHILFNMIALFFFGTYLERLVGDKSFLKVYFIGGLFASLSFTFMSLVFGIPDPRTIAVGASGAVMATLGALMVLRPNLRIYLYFFIPMPLWIFGVGYILMESLYIPSMSTGVAHTAHVAGILAGLVFGYFFKKKEPGYEYETTYGQRHGY